MYKWHEKLQHTFTSPAKIHKQGKLLIVTNTKATAPVRRNFLLFLLRIGFINAGVVVPFCSLCCLSGCFFFKRSCVPFSSLFRSQSVVFWCLALVSSPCLGSFSISVPLAPAFDLVKIHNQLKFKINYQNILFIQFSLIIGRDPMRSRYHISDRNDIQSWIKKQTPMRRNSTGI